MKIVSSYEEAYTLGQPYTSNENALSHTLQYIFDKRYVCYMLCVKDGDYQFVKLESKSGNPVLDKKINKTLKRKKIKSGTKTWRVMGCILKPFKKESTFAKEWIPFLERVKSRLPNGVFILSLSDSVLLPDDVKGDFLPVFAYSGRIGYRDIPIPTYDDIFDSKIGDVETDWSKKKDVAVFRGRSTGCGSTATTNQRLKLATMRNENLDVGITEYTSHLKFNSTTDIEKAEKVAPIVPSLNWKQQSEYKYIIHVDGNVLAYRLLKSMLTNSVILRVTSVFVEWCYRELKPGKHYIEIKPDLSDLEEKVQWCKTHDAECKKIAARAYKFAKKALAPEYIENAFIKALRLE